MNDSFDESSLKNLFISHIANHRSHRSFSADKPVPKELLQKIIETAFQSSTNGNMQTYSIIVTTSKSELDDLALIHDNHNIKNAPVLLTFLSDWTRMEKWCEIRGAFRNWNKSSQMEDEEDIIVNNHPYSNFNAYLTGALDAMVAAQSIALAAEASGLGICFLGSTIWEPQRLHQYLKIPKRAHVVTSMMLGYPKFEKDSEQFPKRKARLDPKAFVHWSGQFESENKLSTKEITDLYKDREAEGWERYIKLYGEEWREKLDTHNLENLAQVYTCLKYSGADFRRWSRGFLKSLTEQGFGDNESPEGKNEGNCAVCGKVSHCLSKERFMKTKFEADFEG